MQLQLFTSHSYKQYSVAAGVMHLQVFNIFIALQNVCYSEFVHNYKKNVDKIMCTLFECKKNIFNIV